MRKRARPAVSRAAGRQRPRVEDSQTRGSRWAPGRAESRREELGSEAAALAREPAVPGASARGTAGVSHATSLVAVGVAGTGVSPRPGRSGVTCLTWRISVEFAFRIKALRCNTVFQGNR